MVDMKSSTTSRATNPSEGLGLITMLQERLIIRGWCIALTGSVLFKGSSTKDLDLVLFPVQKPPLWDHVAETEELAHLLVDCGLNRVHTRDVVTARWRRIGSADTKHVEVWEYNGKRVDLFFFD